MQKSIAKESRRGASPGRLGAAVLALAAVLTLGACRATGGGIPAAPSGNILFKGQADFGFNFTCEVETEKKRAVIRGEITYHDDPSTWTKSPTGIRIHGTVDPFFIELANLTELLPGTTSCDRRASRPRGHREPGSRASTGPRTRRFPRPNVRAGSRSTCCDMGEPAPTDLDGDSFDISLTGGPYAPATTGSGSSRAATSRWRTTRHTLGLSFGGVAC